MDIHTQYLGFVNMHLGVCFYGTLLNKTMTTLISGELI